MVRLPPVDEMIKAFRRKDRAYEGAFIVGVKTTGVFCRPTCRAKPAKAENLEFLKSPADAAVAGYRPCKLCKPLERAGIPPLVARLMRQVDVVKGDRLTGVDLDSLRIDASTARRQFKAHFGITFAQYQRKRRMEQAINAMSNGAGALDAQVAAGFRSLSGFRSAMRALTVEPEAASTVASAVACGRIDTPVGAMIAVVNDNGITCLEFDDQSRTKKLLEHLQIQKRPRPRAIVAGDHPHLVKLREEIRRYFAGDLRDFTAPLSPSGTEFEIRAWKFLSSIPYGQTRSYKEQAMGIGNPAAARAVGRANGRNPIGLVVPCHRVIGASGSLTGYGGGLERKRWLLHHEQKHLGLIML